MVVSFKQAVYINRTLELAEEYGAKVALYIISETSKRLIKVRLDDKGLHFEHDIFLESADSAEAIRSNDEHFLGRRQMFWIYQQRQGLVVDRRKMSRIPAGAIPVTPKMPLPELGRTKHILNLAAIAVSDPSVALARN